MINKIMGSLIILTAIILTIIILNNEGLLPETKFIDNVSGRGCKQLTPSEQLINLIENDFKELERTGQLPSEWSKIEKIEYKKNSQLAKAILGSATPTFKTSPNGGYILEVEILDLEDDTDPGVILQISVLHAKSENKIHEIGRTYTMSQLNNPIEH